MTGISSSNSELCGSCSMFNFFKWWCPYDKPSFPALKLFQKNKINTLQGEWFRSSGCRGTQGESEGLGCDAWAEVLLARPGLYVSPEPWCALHHFLTKKR